MKKQIDDYAAITYQANLGALGQNALPLPTLEQLKSGKYPKGAFIYHGFKIFIENPCYTYRKGVDANGNEWANQMQAHYGYIDGTIGKDGDELDVFVGVYPESTDVFVINQQDANGVFDEHKIMLGFLTEANAKVTYQLSYDWGWRGLSSIIKANISQFQWWLKYGDHTKPLQSNHLPLEGLESLKMQQFNWNNQDTELHGTTLAQALYELRQGSDGALLNCPVSMRDIGEHIGIDLACSFEAMDALLSKVREMDKRMDKLTAILNMASKDGITVIAHEKSDPFKRNGTTNVAVLFELSDGQTITAWFHNPDSTPNKLAPDDTLISWRWQINKKDVTLLVAPESGKDLDMRRIARRLMAFLAKNSASFARANENRVKRMAAISGLESTVAEKSKQLDSVNNELAATEALISDAEIQLANLQAENKKATGNQETDAKDKQGAFAILAKDYGWDADSVTRTVSKNFAGLAKATANNDGSRRLTAKFDEFLRFFGIVDVTDPSGSEFVLDTKTDMLDFGYDMQGYKDAARVFDAKVNDYVAKRKALVVEPKLSNKAAVFDILSNRFGWTQENGLISKTFAGLADSGELSSGERTLTADFDSRERYLAVTDAAAPTGGKVIPETEIDLRDFGYDVVAFASAAKAFDDLVNTYVAERQAEIKGGDGDLGKFADLSKYLVADGWNLSGITPTKDGDVLATKAFSETRKGNQITATFSLRYNKSADYLQGYVDNKPDTNNYKSAIKASTLLVDDVQKAVKELSTALEFFAVKSFIDNKANDIATPYDFTKPVKSTDAIQFANLTIFTRTDPNIAVVLLFNRDGVPVRHFVTSKSQLADTLVSTQKFINDSGLVGYTMKSFPQDITTDTQEHAVEFLKSLGYTVIDSNNSPSKYTIGRSKKNYVQVVQGGDNLEVTLVKDGVTVTKTDNARAIAEWLARVMFVGGGTVAMVKKNLKLKEGADLLDLESMPSLAAQDDDIKAARNLAPETKNTGILSVGDSYIAKDADGIITKYVINSIKEKAVDVKIAARFNTAKKEWIKDDLGVVKSLTETDIAGLENKNGLKIEPYKAQSGRDNDMDFLKDVINAQVNLTDSAVGMQVDALFDKYPDDAEIQDLLDKAIDSITDATKQRASLANQ